MDEAREKIAEIIGKCGDEYYLAETASPETIADQILSIPQLAIVDREANREWSIILRQVFAIERRYDFRLALQYFQKQVKGWVKEIKK